DWKTLSMALVPIGGIGLFLGLLMLEVTQLRHQPIVLPYIGAFRALLIAAGVTWSAWLGARIVMSSDAARWARSVALLLYATALVLRDATCALSFCRSYLRYRGASVTSASVRRRFARMADRHGVPPALAWSD